MDFAHIAQKIIALKNADLALRNQLLRLGQIDKGYNEEMEKLHIGNARELESIMDNIAYPSAEKVGKEASEAAWLIIQHAISLPEFMKKCAALLTLEVQDNKADPVSLAYLTDRIAVFENRPQHYGTQFDWDEQGELSPNPYDSLSKVNKRREAIGLNTLQEQTVMIRQLAKSKNRTAPSNFEERKLEIEAWKHRVGWTK
jgi:hypothetical protein